MTVESTVENKGNFFEDFSVGQEIIHATPRTLTTGDAALYMALFGSRFALQSSDFFAQSLGFSVSPLDDLLIFHVVFGKSVPDVSLNAVANLGYAGGRFLTPVFPGNTLTARSTVIGLRENTNGKTGIVYVNTTGTNQHGEVVLDYARWVMVAKRNPDTPAPEPVIPTLPAAVAASDLRAPEGIDYKRLDASASGSTQLWDDFEAGMKFDHRDGVTVEEAEHMLATRLYQNTARVHFDGFTQKDSRFGRRLIYGGHVISLARALSFNGLSNGFHIAAINAGRHVAPLFAGDTVFAWSEIVDKAPLECRADIGALRVCTRATKNRLCANYPGARDDDTDGLILDFDYWLLMPRR
ncbi:MAG: MaoC family dehydratase [Parvularculales bacterium]